ncbi:protein of unknown function [Micropruina glycogenica]|uniref:Uncharacterized protein n=1 Tax=Micropruina glycogenica TaxID=75385 RepID=A0A2N9JIM2_9ACTN|nr:protein of unknown function [Micropruina glycogenica]
MRMFRQPHRLRRQQPDAAAVAAHVGVAITSTLVKRHSSAGSALPAFEAGCLLDFLLTAVQLRSPTFAAVRARGRIRTGLGSQLRLELRPQLRPRPENAPPESPSGRAFPLVRAEVARFELAIGLTPKPA